MREFFFLSLFLFRRVFFFIFVRIILDFKLIREVVESFRFRRWVVYAVLLEDFSLTLGVRSRRIRSFSFIFGEFLVFRKGSFSGRLSSVYSLGFLIGVSFRQSLRSQRKFFSGDLRVFVIRERKNSITEISDNEDDFLEYYRRQR